MTDPYSDDQELEQLKTWWKTYGNALLLGIALGLSILMGNKYWSQHKQERAEAASAIYDGLVDNYREKAFDKLREASESLKGDYAATPYAGLAAMISARVNLVEGKIDDARRELQWTLDNATDDGTKHAARLRLARIVADANEVDAALFLLDVSDIAGFELDYHELRGDLTVLKGDKQAAREAYRMALKELDEFSSYKSTLSMKLDALGPEANE
ncbi:MAG: tetratricopeptide repeat protein [Gammaproteobacteria bacterium]|nr:tetratricopeptide repeat protein [Gammaproteobacteria bacterium]